jgi:predicted MPP superfamily phosphohydrolase
MPPLVTLSPLTLFLFVAAAVGNASLLVFNFNYIYGLVVPRWMTKILRMVTGLLMFALPVALWHFCNGYLLDYWDPLASDPGRAFLSVYIAVCWFLGLVVFPTITLRRLLRRRPVALLSNHTQTVDIAERLGVKPYGQSKHGWMARLPFNEVFQVEFNEKTFCLPRVPLAWDGLTILHLSDLHFCGTPDRPFYEQVLDLCREQEADLVTVTGDIVDSNRLHRWVVPLLSKLRWKTAGFAVLGNHDCWHDPNQVRRRLRRVGLRVLGNGWEEIEVRGERLLVVGNETPWFKPAPDLAACPPDLFRLCLSHTPDTMKWARTNGIDLMLAGHNHGGQVRFPLIGSVFVPSLYSRRYDCGIFHEAPTLLHVSRGLAGKEPLRFRCRPEVTRIVLRSPVALKDSAVEVAEAARAISQSASGVA